MHTSIMFTSSQTTNNNNTTNSKTASSIQRELLALLDSERANADGNASSVSQNSNGNSHHRHRHSPTHGSSQRDNNNNNNAASRDGSRGSSSAWSRERGDRSLPPVFKYWARPLEKKEKKRRERPESNNAVTGAARRIIRRCGKCYEQFARTSELSWLQYSILVFVGACLLTYAKILLAESRRGNGRNNNDNRSFRLDFLRSGGNSDALKRAAAPRFQFSFSDAAWRGEEEAQFETLVPPSEIDFGMQRRLSNAEEEEEEGRCDDLLLYMPRKMKIRGTNGRNHAGELNGYLLAALLATFLGKAMVVMDAPPPAPTQPEYDDFGMKIGRNDNWFDCPVDTFETDIAGGTSGATFPTGISRLVRHPTWLSRSCPLPCQSSYDYSKWDELSKHHVPRATCQNDDDREARVFVVGARDVRPYFENQWNAVMGKRTSETVRVLYDWGLRLGAEAHEARELAKLKEEGAVWDYVGALMARSGVIRFQPWIARDVRKLIDETSLPLNWPYYGMYALRGNDDDDRGFDLDSGGAGGMEQEQRQQQQQRRHSPVKAPNPFPFHAYLNQFTSSATAAAIPCNMDKAHPVYIVTDDPYWIQMEIDKLPKGLGGNTILKECHKMKFIFSPVQPSLMRDGGSSRVGGIEGDGGGGGGDTCADLHRINIASIADLMIMAKSDTFVLGESDGSPFGRLIRVFRATVNDFPGRERDGAVLVKNTRVASSEEKKKGAGVLTKGPPWL